MISSYPSICFSGLSPLARGTRDDSIAADESERFIPAGAGNSAGNITNKINVNGLSPLARGTHPLRCRIPLSLRFIPAGAGNSTHLPFSPGRGTVYPRWRGEHARLVGVFREIAGLSPLARGTLQQSETSWLAVRFIPAGAGNTEQQVFQMASRAVYPRWRGELPRRLAQQSRPRGLSPLARGTLEMTKNARRRNRFIPAGAGNSNLV